MKNFVSGFDSCAPQEYTDFILMRNVYHCTPSELEQQDISIIDLHIGFLNTERKEAKLIKNRADQEEEMKKNLKK